MIGLFIFRVIADDRSNNLTLPQRWTVMHRCNADLVVRILDDDWEKPVALSNHVRHLLDHIHILTAQWQRIDPSIGENDELHKVNGIRAFTKHTALRSALAAVLKKAFHILKVTDTLIGCEGLGGVEQLAVTGKDVTNLPLRNGYQWGGMDNILNGHQIMH